MFGVPMAHPLIKFLATPLAKLAQYNILQNLSENALLVIYDIY